MRGQALSWSLCLGLSLMGCFGGGGDDGGGGSGGGVAVPADKPLDDLSGAQLESLCQKNLANLNKVADPKVECTAQAIASSSDAASCTAARDACLEGTSASALTCADFEDQGSVGPTTDAGDGPASSGGLLSCSLTPAEIEQCLRDVVAWTNTLSCETRSTADVPACWEEQNTQCPALNELIEGDGPSVTLDGGIGEPFDSAVGEECQPGDIAACTCGDDSPGYATCADSGAFGSCNCAVLPELDAGIDAGPTTGVDASVEGPFYCGDTEYVFGFGAVCDACGADSCCASYLECVADETCACFYFCAAGSVDACLVDCGLEAVPTVFVDHIACMSDACGVECGL